MPDAKPVLLSVDDDQAVLEDVLRALEKTNVEVVTAQSGKDGLGVLQAREIDVVMADMRMPQMSGTEFLQQAAELQPNCRRIVISDDDDLDATKSAINDAGVSVYLDKPWKDSELKRIVAEELELARLAKENTRLHAIADSQNEELRELNDDLEARVAARTEELEHTNGVLQTTLAELEQTHEAMIDLVANIAAMPNPESENTQRKLRLALAIGELLGLDEEDLTHLKNATRLHRLGWIGIPRRILAKPRCDLSVEERYLFEKHPEYAEAVLLSVPRLKTAGDIVRSQHEAWNGEGFPHRSVGEGIPIAARILAVARDYYDLVAGHLTQAAMTPAAALAHIVDQADTTYDPGVVKAFQAALPDIDENDPNVDEIIIKTMSLLDGMRLARDLTTEEGAVLLAKGSTVTETAIATLLNLERRSDQELTVFVLKDSLPDAQADG